MHKTKRIAKNKLYIQVPVLVLMLMRLKFWSSMNKKRSKNKVRLEEMDL